MRNLIEFSGMQTSQNFTFIFDTMTFRNVTFFKRGAMFLFQQLMTNQVVLMNSVFSDITSGFIQIEAANKQSVGMNTRVLISNCSFSSIDANFVSLIQVNELGELAIEHSTFKGVS